MELLFEVYAEKWRTHSHRTPCFSQFQNHLLHVGVVSGRFLNIYFIFFIFWNGSTQPVVRRVVCSEHRVHLFEVMKISAFFTRSAIFPAT